jgi:regulator of sigma E protease
MTVLVAILGLAVLMIVHEGGHYLAARAAGLRVLKFSIGFGPTFFKIQPERGFWCFTAFGDRVKVRLKPHDPEKHGPTVFQVAMIPFLAYVQIAGMNPLEENDPNDKGSYANASLWARVSTIFAGPLANYLFASVFFFLAFWLSGIPTNTDSTKVVAMPDKPAIAAGIQTEDRIVEIQGETVDSWQELSTLISANPGKEINVVVERAGERVGIDVTPEATPEGRGIIGVSRLIEYRPATFQELLLLSVKMPPIKVQEQLEGFRNMILRKSKDELGGPVEMVQGMAVAVSMGWPDFLGLLGVLSAWLAAFNLLPIPALDGGRLMFLGYEATTRRRPNPTVEAHIHAIGLVMMLGLMVYVTIKNQFK